MRGTSHDMSAKSGARWRLRESFWSGVVWLGAGLVAAALLWILVDIALRGMWQISPEFLTRPIEDAGRKGGIGPIILSTTLILFVTLTVSVPLSLGTAIALTETPGGNTRFAGNIRRCLDVLAGVPSIVFGLFGNAFFAITLGLGYSILSGGLTLACMVLPLLIRVSEQAISAVPSEVRMGAAALGLGRAAALRRVVLPAAAPALAGGMVLGVGRALAETAALIFTSGYVARTPASLLDSGRTLSVHIYDLAMNVPTGGPRAYATACVLVMLLLIVNVAAACLLRAAGLATRSAPGASG